jgi:hypothetical protein
MPILSAEGMVDLVPITTESSTPAAIQGTPYLVVGAASANRAATAITRDGDWLDMRSSPAGGTATSTSKYVGVYRPLSDYTNITASTYLYGGVRIKCLITGTLLPLLRFADSTQPTVSANAFSVFLGSDIPGGTVSGVEVYLEWALDMANKKILRRVDGVRIADIPIPSTAFETLFTNNVMAITYGCTTAVSAAMSTVVGYAIKDIYIGEKVAGETSDWLGPRIVTPLPLSSVTSEWQASSGTVLDALNTPITDSASYAAPYVTTDAAGTEATIKLTVPDVAGKIDAVVVTSIGKRRAATIGGLAAAMKNASGEDTRAVKLLTTTNSFCHLGTFVNAPGAVPWTKALLTDVTLKVKPSN